VQALARIEQEMGNLRLLKGIAEKPPLHISMKRVDLLHEAI